MTKKSWQKASFRCTADDDVERCLEKKVARYEDRMRALEDQAVAVRKARVNTASKLRKAKAHLIGYRDHVARSILQEPEWSEDSTERHKETESNVGTIQ